MRSIVLSVCVIAAACSGQDTNSPTSPARAVPGSSGAFAVDATRLPFRGSFTRASQGSTDCPPTCPPTTLRITGQLDGTATQLGRFTASMLDVVVVATNAATGTVSFTAANGDQLFADTIGGESAFIPPNVSKVTLAAIITGGTGRFASATGTFTLLLTEAIDFATNTASGSGTFDGTIDLNH